MKTLPDKLQNACHHCNQSCDASRLLFEKTLGDYRQKFEHVPTRWERPIVADTVWGQTRVRVSTIGNYRSRLARPCDGWQDNWLVALVGLNILASSVSFRVSFLFTYYRTRHVSVRAKGEYYITSASVKFPIKCSPYWITLPLTHWTFFLTF